MQIIRTIAWIVLTAILVGFIVMNWGEGVPVNFWPQESNVPMHFIWPVWVVALFFLALGFVPLWLYTRAVRWRLTRRIANLENTVRALTPSEPVAAAPITAEPAPLTTPAEPIAPGFETRPDTQP